MPSKKLIAGNWKMNGLRQDARARAESLAKLAPQGHAGLFDMVLCPPAPLLQDVAAALNGSAIRYGGQDCHAEASGAFTGDISAALLKDVGCAYVIVGHSERRQYHKETSAAVAAKAKAAHEAGLIAIICIGETDAERTAGQEKSVVSAQLADSLPATTTAENTAVAYEPVWAIGTGKTASADDILQMHAHIRAGLSGKVAAPDKVRLLYGGSVKGANAAEILHTPNVDGVLVGGASLKADEFWAIAQAAG